MAEPAGSGETVGANSSNTHRGESMEKPRSPDGSFGALASSYAGDAATCRAAVVAGPGADVAVAEILDRVEAARATGGDDARRQAVARQHALGKLSARERIAVFGDPGSFREAGGLVRPLPEHGEALDAPADGFIVGDVRVDGRSVAISATDFTVMGGRSGKAGGLKSARAIQYAIDHGLPYVSLMDGGGHHIQEGLDSRHFASVSTPFKKMVDLFGWTPICAAMMGPGFAGPSNFAALADFVVMVRGTSTMGIAGPALVKAATGGSGQGGTRRRLDAG